MTITHAAGLYLVECPDCLAGIATPLITAARTWRDGHRCRKATS